MIRSDAQQDRSAQRTDQRPALLALAEKLYAVLTDGAPPAGYHVRHGFALRNAVTKQPIRSSFSDRWCPARERHSDGSETDRDLNAYVLAQHLRGRYDVAWTAPSWSSLVVLDIDRPALPDDADVDALWDANRARDEELAAVWRAFDFGAERQPVVLATPGGGYHLYLPLCRSRDPAHHERTWPNQWAREWVQYVLDQAGLSLRPGRLELYPSGVRLRAPCGRGSALLVPTRPDDPDDLRLQLCHARRVEVIDGKSGARTTVVRRQIEPMTCAFLDALEHARRPLEEWVGGDDAPPAWSATWGPFGDRAAVRTLAERKKRSDSVQADVSLFQHKEEVQEAAGAPGPHLASDGLLLRGRAFYRRVADLSKHGLTDLGTRHDSALKLAWYLGVLCNVDREQVLSRVETWLCAHEHASATRDRSPAGFVRQTLREVAHYYDTRIVRCQRRAGARVPDVVTAPLERPDQQLIERYVRPEAQSAVGAIVRYLRGHAAADGCVPHPVELSGKILSTLCGDGRIPVQAQDGACQRRRAYVVAMDELVGLGVLAMHTDYSKGHHGRRYTCWYRFGSGALPCRDAAGRWVLGQRRIEEGTLRVLSDGTRSPPQVALERDSGLQTHTSTHERDPWWVRMYRRRAFTPAEFCEGDVRKLVAGPFRHRRDLAAAITAGPPSSVPPGSDGVPPPTVPPAPPNGPPSGGGAGSGRMRDSNPAASSSLGQGSLYDALADLGRLSDVDWKRIAFGTEARWQRARAAPPPPSADAGQKELTPEDRKLVDGAAPGLRDELAEALRAWRRRRPR